MEGCGWLLQGCGWCIALILVVALTGMVLLTAGALGLAAVEAGAAGLSVVIGAGWPVVFLILAGLAAFKAGR